VGEGGPEVNKRMIIRAEEERDQAAVFEVNRHAFDREDEAKLVDVLRVEADPVVSLVAEEDGAVIGHIMFSPVELSGSPDLKIMGLGPMAVTPQRQRSGVGSSLVRAGVERCRALGYGAVVVLGHPEFYPRFGFRPASQFGVGSEYEVPDDVFMLLELQPGYLADRVGTVRYHDAFRNV